MAKAATAFDQGAHFPSGKWVWRDDTKGLELVTNSGAGEKGGKRAGRQRQGVHFQDSNAKRVDRGATPSLGSRAVGLGRGRQSRVAAAGLKSPRQTKEEKHVTLEKVKDIAIGMLSEVEEISESFEDIFTTEQFDEFLMYLLNFFHWFFEKRAHEEKPNPMNIEPSLAEIQYYADLCVKLEAAQKQLGQAYCILVLGIGLEHKHHMACGMSRVSSTYKDRSMYETLYSFCTFVVWITFRRKDYDMVRKELGHMLRSDTFNPALRVKNAPDPDPLEEEEKQEPKKEEKLTPAEYRRIHGLRIPRGKRPAIKSIINQRSPALVSILPSPKEEAHYLFKRNRSPKTGTEVASQFEMLSLNQLKLGIIGEPLSQFNPKTLTPLGAENEDEEAEGEDKERRGSIMPGTPAHGKTAQEANMSRQPTAVSTATTEALSDED